jgi:hypothetical protein
MGITLISDWLCCFCTSHPVFRDAHFYFFLVFYILGLLFSKPLFLRSLRINSRIPGLLVGTIYIYIYIHTQTHILLCPFDPILCYGFPLWGFAIILLDTPHSLGFLWTSDRPVAETSTWQHTTSTRDRHPWFRWDSKPQSQQTSGRTHTP